MQTGWSQPWPLSKVMVQNGQPSPDPGKSAWPVHRAIRHARLWLALGYAKAALRKPLKVAPAGSGGAGARQGIEARCAEAVAKADAKSRR